MKRNRYTDEQMAFALSQAESGRTAVEEICRKMAVSQATFRRWKKKFAGIGVAEIRRLKRLEEENVKLKRLVGDMTSTIRSTADCWRNAYARWFLSMPDARDSH